MDQYIEFVVNHWWLVGIWAAFLIALLWDNNRRNGQTVSTAEATTMINRQNALVLDIRDKADFKAGHLVNAVNIPYASLAQRMNELDKERERPIVLVCKTGQTVSMAGKMLREKGFNAVRMKGGMMEWNSQNLPVVKN
ncbi:MULTISPECIES: rhodanese-like domain-containing protein [Thalassolituus]|jgi:rhodanese-related sulfurtransferase|uniref:Rhodanese-related sulfurtransferase n=1 Tax=Thalassolituus maritimus TaxID=484498 RepID=A0A1N7NS55_9GAMM|nr:MULTISPECIES: rhodanese-like domain-containing protein [Thalassolituus]KZY96735.1 sulfurtransferase [Oleibacter sp. HI0075]MAX85642.1 rhodanese-like domain-containing protein [Oceanospirillaceae bacterium]MEE3159317.1 rhodanese-like domain-containing protein [Pseudomonadota bacterium]KZY99926.1 sulfurtransferase [Oleibacter sp. HI0075]MEE3191327.1 rhodanese-like domain-containing protein [Pseudomonadota bacterium]|tara:strand:+ start:614 stop:1027 length:414 start_codon:yes stop_codon:yes gene_type:complete